ncbi:UPF0158 family protein [Myxococcota bacterium]
MRELNIDWSALHSAFQMPVPEVHCFLSLTDGKVLKLPPGDPGMASIHSEKTEYVPIETVPSRIQYQWVDEFSKTIEDETLRGRVEAAINGKGAFRRFKDILLTIPDERRRWFEFRDHKMRERITEWVQEKGILPLNEPPWDAEEGTSIPKADNSLHDIEAVRDLLIDWFDGKDGSALQPLELEKLAATMGEKFIVRSKK